MTMNGSIKTLAAVGLSAGLLCAAAVPALARSSSYCDAYARDYANRTTHSGENVVGSALTGAIGGAVLGGILGGKDDVGKGALIGAGVGTTAGAVSSSGRWRRNYEYAFDRCMSSGQTAGRPTPGSEEWYDYCEAKYRSFNPDTGMYRSASGGWKPCR
jgi:BA14K-like protein/YmgG-like glycine-zipper protein